MKTIKAIRPTNDRMNKKYFLFDIECNRVTIENNISPTIMPGK